MQAETKTERLLPWDAVRVSQRSAARRARRAERSGTGAEERGDEATERLRLISQARVQFRESWLTIGAVGSLRTHPKEASPISLIDNPQAAVRPVALSLPTIIAVELGKRVSAEAESSLSSALIDNPRAAVRLCAEFFGARGGTRTHTTLWSPGRKTGASTGSATPAN